jgi:beta-xylosidase
LPEFASLSEHAGWLRLKAQPATDLKNARNTLTQKLWDSVGTIDVKMDISQMKDGQRAGFTFISGSDFGWAGVGQENSERKVMWNGDEGPSLNQNEMNQSVIWLHGVNSGDRGMLYYSLDGKTWSDTGQSFRMIFRFWKGARIGIFSYGPNGGSADFDFVHYNYGASIVPLGLPAPTTQSK